MAKVKFKTHKATKKRFRLTATGKVKHRPSGKSHRNVRMSAKRTRNLRGTKLLDDCMVPSITAALGKYSS
jgi:large subunit ribosomal protein L35